MTRPITGATLVAGVVGRPVRHSLSPLIHNAWLTAAGIDGVYVAFSPSETGLATLLNGFRGAVVRGLNVTLPFKAEALALADQASDAARAAGAANLLVFHDDDAVMADNTDGLGLLAALRDQADFEPAAGPVVVLGAFGDKEDQAREAARERILAGLGKHTGAEIGLSAHHMGSGGKVFLFGAVRKEAAHVRARARTQPTASGQRAGSASS